MQLVSINMKLLIVLIGLACVAPGLSQRQRFRQDAAITTEDAIYRQTRQASANKPKNTQLSTSGQQVNITPGNKPKTRNNSPPKSPNKPKAKIKNGPTSTKKPKRAIHPVTQRMRPTKTTNKPKRGKNTSVVQRNRPTSASKPKPTRTANKGQKPKGQRCYTPENDIGQCFTLSNCASIANVFNVYPQNIATQYVRTAQRSCGNVVIRGDPVVCCGYNQEFIAPTTARPFFPNTVDTTTTARNPFFPNNPSTTPSIIVAPPTSAPATTRRPIATTTTTTTTPPPPPSTTSGISDRSGDSCRGPDLKYGVCTPLASCPPLLSRLQENPSDSIFVKFLQFSNDICANEYSVVCCPSTDQEQFRQLPVFPENRNDIPKKLPTMQDGCGYSDNAFRKIVGGTTSKVGAWPWIALIGYDDGVSASPFKCGGALISSRHVLTAAHCIRADLTFVRLGEHDLSTDTETNHVDVPVSKVLKHAQYNRQDGRNDIAMLYLDRNVQFSAKITPICVPQTPELLTKSYVSRTPFVAGWGRTMEGGKSATVLQELQIPVYDNSVCRDLYQKQNKLISQQQFDNAVICAGELGGGKDTCQGDSGGPLMTPEPFGNSVRFHLIGIVSYGIGCARPDTPGVYTRVTNFIDWIQNAVADTP